MIHIDPLLPNQTNLPTTSCQLSCQAAR